MIKYKIVFTLFFVVAILTNTKAQTNTNNLEICYGGLTWADIHCDSTKFAYIADKEIYLYDRINNKKYEIDSMVVDEIIPFGEVVGHYIKGNKLSNYLANILYKYKIGVGILAHEIYYTLYTS